MDEVRSLKYVEWFERWLNSLASVESSRSSSWNEDPADYTRYQNAFSQSEVAVELYHALHQPDLSLKEISHYITQIGNLLYQVDLRQLATQPKSRQRQMLAAIFDCVDISQTLPECHVEDSFAYVYMLVRLLYEILLYTRSMSVRSLCFQQIMRNAHVLRVIFGLISRPVALRTNEGPLEDSTASIVDSMSTVGQLPRKFSFNALDNILHKMLTSKDINMKICGMELVSLCPRLVACNPKLMADLRDVLIESMEECAYTSAISLFTVMPYVAKEVAEVFLRTTHDHAIAVEFSAQRVQSFCAIALGCLKLPVYHLAYRMCWNIWIHIDSAGGKRPSENCIVKESQFYLMLTSTIICMDHPELCVRQRRRLEAIIYEHKENEGSLEAAFCMNILYKHQGEVKEIGRLLKLDIQFPDVTRELHKTLFQQHLKHFEKSLNVQFYITAIGDFETLISFGPANLKFICELKDAFCHLRSNWSDSTIRIIEAVSRVYSTPEGEYEHLHNIVFRALEAMVRMCYICEPQKFTQLISHLKNPPKGTNLIYLLKPLLSAKHFMCLDDRLRPEQVNAWVSTLYYPGHIKPPKIYNVTSLPLSINLYKGTISSDADPVRVVITTKQDTFNTDLINVHIRKLINYASKRVSTGSATQNLINLSLRLGFYEEAAFCLKQLELWTDKTVLWFNGLYHYAVAECEMNPMKAIEARVQGLDSLDGYHYQCTVRSLQKVANDVMAARMNYTMPALVTHTWCTLKLILQIATCHLEKAISGTGEDLNMLTSVFVALLGNYRVLRWTFIGTCSETRYICEIYEGLCLLLHLICERHRVKKEMLNKGQDNSTSNGKPIPEPQETLRQYITKVFEVDDTHFPQTLFIVDLLAPSLRAKLYCISSFLPFSTDINCNSNSNITNEEVTNSSQAEKRHQINSVRELPLHMIFKEFVGYYRVRINRKKSNSNQNTYKRRSSGSQQCDPVLSCISRDLDWLTVLEPLTRACDTDDSNGECWSELISRMTSIQLPTPVGVLKNFPLPFPAFTALLEYEKRVDEGPVAIHLQGSIRNASCLLPWVKIRLTVAGSEEDVVVFNKRFRLRKNVIDEYIHVLLSIRHIELCRFSCVAMDGNGRPRGAAAHFLPFTREFTSHSTFEQHI